MPFTMEVTGMEELIAKMQKLPDKGRDVAALALFEGAGVVANAVSSAIQGIATAPFKYAKNGEKRLPSPEEKALVAGARHGVAKFKKSSSNVNTSVGFQNAGYGAITWNHAKSSNSRTKYKRGSNGKMVHASQGRGASMKPIPLIVNSIESGTSFMQAQPFLRKGLSQSAGAAAGAIEAGIESRLEMLGLD